MGLDIRELGFIIRKMEEGYMCLKMEMCIEGFLRRIERKGRELMNMRMEMCIMECINGTKRKDGEN